MHRCLRRPRAEAGEPDRALGVELLELAGERPPVGPVEQGAGATQRLRGVREQAPVGRAQRAQVPILARCFVDEAGLPAQHVDEVGKRLIGRAEAGRPQRCGGERRDEGVTRGEGARRPGRVDEAVAEVVEAVSERAGRGGGAGPQPVARRPRAEEQHGDRPCNRGQQPPLDACRHHRHRPGRGGREDVGDEGRRCAGDGVRPEDADEQHAEHHGQGDPGGERRRPTDGRADDDEHAPAEGEGEVGAQLVETGPTEVGEHTGGEPAECGVGRHLRVADDLAREGEHPRHDDRGAHGAVGGRARPRRAHAGEKGRDPPAAGLGDRYPHRRRGHAAVYAWGS